MERRLRARLRPTNDSRRVDETYIRVKGKWVYLYRAVDSSGATIDFLLSAKLDETKRVVPQPTRRRTRALSSPGQGPDPPASKHHQNFLEVGRDGQLGIDVPIRLDMRKPVVVGENQPSITSKTLRRALADFRALRLKVNKASNGRVNREGEADSEILPVLWQDNYFALLPGETRQVTATYRLGEKSVATPSVEVEDWNVNRKIANVQKSMQIEQR